MDENKENYYDRKDKCDQVRKLIFADMWEKTKRVLFGIKPPLPPKKKEEVKTGFVWKGR